MGFCCLAVCTALAVVLLILPLHGAKDAVAETQKCDLYEGRWIYDESYPLYDPQKCPFILQQFNCLRNGRADLQYQKYRWQPNHCNLNRWWDGREFGFGRRVRGKRIMFVGDSLSMNQWQSLACIILSAYPRSPYISFPAKSKTASTLLFPQLNLTLIYVRNAYIVGITAGKQGKVLNLNSVPASADLWLESDVLIFNSWHWWLHTGRKQPWDWIQDGDVVRKEMDRLEAYEKALRTWTRWVDQNVDANRVDIFFQGVSPDHCNGSNWGVPEAQQCGGQQQPLKGPAADDEGSRADRADRILKNVLKSCKKRVQLLDIRKMSQLRVDGHPSVYGNPRNIGMDCTHWCLPGVPDAWNQLLYAALLGDRL